MGTIVVLFKKGITEGKARHIIKSSRLKSMGWMPQLCTILAEFDKGEAKKYIERIITHEEVVYAHERPKLYAKPHQKN